MIGLNPAPNVLEVAQFVAAGRVAEAKKNFAGAIGAFTQAVTKQDLLAYDEPPDFHYPVRESLGGLWLRANEAGRSRSRVPQGSDEEPPQRPLALRPLAEPDDAEEDDRSRAWCACSTRRRGSTPTCNSPSRVCSSRGSPMNWLVKEEPEHYNFEALVKDGRTTWTGVKNPLAQKHLQRDQAGRSGVLLSHRQREVGGRRRPRAGGCVSGFEGQDRQTLRVRSRTGAPPEEARDARVDQIVREIRDVRARADVAAVGDAGHRRGMVGDREDE